MKEKKARNKELYCKKFGYEEYGDKEPTNKPMTYRKLSEEYDLSIPYILRVINRYRDKLGYPERQ